MVKIVSLTIQLLYGGLWGIKRKCGVVSLSNRRLWNALHQINNTPHLSVYIRTIYNNTSNECYCYPDAMKFSRFVEYAFTEKTKSEERNIK